MDYDRRTFLGTATAATLAGLAGCSTVSGAIKAPQPSKSKLESGGWSQTSDSTDTLFKREISGVTLKASARTVLYEDAELRKQITEKTRGFVTSPLSVLFGSRVQTSPNISDIPTQTLQDQVNNQIKSQAESQFKSRLEKRGIKNFKETGTKQLTLENGKTVDLTQYSAEYQIPDQSFLLGDGEPVTIPGDTLTITGHLAVWDADSGMLIVGGAHPSENYAKTVDVTSAITVDIDLGLTPKKYQSELLGLISSTK